MLQTSTLVVDVTTGWRLIDPPHDPLSVSPFMLINLEILPDPQNNKVQPAGLAPRGRHGENTVLAMSYEGVSNF